MCRNLLLLLFLFVFGLTTGWSQSRSMVSVTASQEAACLGESVDLHASYTYIPLDPITYTFEDGMQGWTTIDADGHGNAWERTGYYQSHGGSYCMYAKYNYNYSHLDYLVSPQITLGVGKVSFYAKKYSSYWDDTFRVYLSTSGNNNASNFSIELTSGDVIPSTSYTKYEYDLSPYQGQGYIAIVYTAAANQFYLFVDDITIYDDGSTGSSGDMTYNFDDGSLQGWTTIDADGDGYNWRSNDYFGGHNGSTGLAFSQSFTKYYDYNTYQYVELPLFPDNYLVAPFKMNVKPGAYLSFWACNQDVAYSGFHGEHFGVAVSTTNNTSASAFTTIQEWTLAAKDRGQPTNANRSGERTQGNWHFFTVDLSAYVGQNIWVALRHFNCTDEFYIDVDDITLFEGTDDDPGGGGGDDEVTYHWSNGMTGPDITVSPTITTTYTVTAIQNGTTVGSAQKTIVVYSDPNLTLTTNTSGSSICAGDSITIYVMVPELVAILAGDILCTDGSIVRYSQFASSGKTAMGVVFYVDATGQHGWAVSLSEVQTNKRWSSENVNVSGLMTYSHWMDAVADIDGYSNTQRIRNFGNETKYPAAWAVDFDNGWYLPAIGQLSVLFGSLNAVNNSLNEVGTPISYTSGSEIWSSTASSNSQYAMMIIPQYERIIFDRKSVSHKVRAVINF